MIPLKQRLTDLEDSLELNYRKLSRFQKDLDVSAHTPSQFELTEEINNKILPRIRVCELEYWGILRQFSPKCDIPDLDAQSAIRTITQDLQGVRWQAMSPEVLDPKVLPLLESILQKLDEPGTAAAAKAKFAVNVIPGILTYEFEFDTESILRRAFKPLKQLFGEAAKK